jgi:hypothetical protein
MASTKIAFPSGSDQLTKVTNDAVSQQIVIIDANIEKIHQQLLQGKKYSHKVRNELKIGAHLMQNLADNYIHEGWGAEIQYTNTLILTPSIRVSGSLSAKMFCLYFNLSVAEAAHLIQSSTSLKYEYKLSWDVANALLEESPRSEMLSALKTFFISNKWNVREIRKYTEAHSAWNKTSKDWVIILAAK